MPERAIPSVLIVEDEINTLDCLRAFFAQHGFAPRAVGSVDRALQDVDLQCPDAVLLDLHLGDNQKGGISLYKTLRARPRTASVPILLMTGAVGDDEALECIRQSLGSEKIIPKPFDPYVLLEKLTEMIKADAGPLQIDTAERKAWFEGVEIKLTPRQFDLFRALHEGPASHEELLLRLWGAEFDPKSVEVAIHRLKQALNAYPRLSIESGHHRCRLVVLPAHPQTALHGR